MELQDRLSDFERAGYALFAISYDPVDRLAAFAAQREITYPLLSDEGSHTIRALGLLNEHLAEQHTAYGAPVREHFFGVPYPGTFVLDEQGTILEKRFEQSYRVRPSGAALAGELPELAEPAEPATPPARITGSVEAAGLGLAVAAWVEPPRWRPFQQVSLQLAFTVAPGLHVYGEPVPAGYVPLTVAVEADVPLVAGRTRLPAPRPFRVEGLDEAFVVYEGAFRGHLLVSVQTVQVQPITLRLRVMYQACSDTLCHPPAELRLALPLEGQDVLRD